MTNDVLEKISQQYKRDGHRPAARWHLRRKFSLMALLFRKYMSPGCSFLDIGCGEGDCLNLARMICPTADLWGVDICEESIKIARSCLPGAHLVVDDIRHLGSWPQASFDVVHEFGTACLMDDWDVLARTYLSLVRPGGYVLWELPEAFSMVHLNYLFSPAPRQDGESKYSWNRFSRTFSARKYNFRSRSSVEQYLNKCGYEHRILDRVDMLHYHARWIYRVLDRVIAFLGGEKAFDFADRVTRMVLPSSSGYYLVLQRTSANNDLSKP